MIDRILIAESPEVFTEKRLGGRISSRAWRMWEDGEGMPSTAMIEIIASELNVPITLFLAPADGDVARGSE